MASRIGPVDASSFPEASMSFEVIKRNVDAVMADAS